MKRFALAVVLAAAALPAVAATVNENTGICWMSLAKVRRADAPAVLASAPDRERAIAHANAWQELTTGAVLDQNRAKLEALNAYAASACKAVGVKPAQPAGVK